MVAAFAKRLQWIVRDATVWWRRRTARRRSAAEEQSAVERWQWGYTIRIDWSDGTHDLFSHHTWPAAAARRARRNHKYWQAFGLRPETWTIVAANRDDVRRHTSFCTSPHCPSRSALPPR